MRNQIAITQFKARCLKLLETVSRTGAELIVTKRGKPLARVTAARKVSSLKGTVTFRDERDDLHGTGAEWELE